MIVFHGLDIYIKIPASSLKLLAGIIVFLEECIFGVEQFTAV